MSQKQASTNFAQYQKAQREETCEKIEKAILYLRKSGIPITKKAIANEVGCHENTLRLPYIKEFLSNFEEFQPHDKKSKTMTLEAALVRIASLEDQLSHSRTQNRTLRLKLDQTQKDRDMNEDKYRRLLGRYQIDVGKMKINL